MVLYGLAPVVLMVLTGSFPDPDLFIIFYFSLVLGLIRMHTGKDTLVQNLAFRGGDTFF